MSATYDADVIVVGLGAMGANATWRLAERGLRVLGIERFTPGHSLGSSHGHSRVFRVACLEHPNLVTMARRSRDLWVELGEITGRRILDQTGIITIGDPAGPVLTAIRDGASLHELPVERVAHDELSRYAPGQENIPAGWEGLWDPEGGVVRPEEGVIAAVEAAERAGASILTDTRVTAVTLVEGGAEVATAVGVYRAPQVVVTVGAWLGKLLPALPVRPLRVPMTWFTPRDPSDDRFTLENFPVFIRTTDDGTSYWGHGSVDGFGVKVGMDWDDNFQWTDPDEIERAISRRDWQRVSRAVAEGIPGLDPNPLSITTCMVTHTPDGQFIIGRSAGDPRLVIGGGDSGHAYKHATGIGELIAQLTVGEQPYVDPSFVSPDRFDGLEQTFRGADVPNPHH